MSELKPANCCICGRIVDTREQVDGGDAFGCELADGRWTCSPDCYDTTTGERRRSPSISEGEIEAALRETLVGGRIEVLLDALEGGPNNISGGLVAVTIHPTFATKAAKAIRDLIGVTRSLEASSKARATTEVEVKALEWTEQSQHWHRASSALGVYSITEYSGMRRSGFKLKYGGGFTSYFDDMPSAKAAAQLDYATRIRSALMGGE